MTKRRGTILMTGGLLLMAAALFLTCYNIWEERQAKASAAAALEQLRQETPGTVKPDLTKVSEDIRGDPPEEFQGEVGETAVPDYLLDPEMEMPTVEIDGQKYIGVLAIPVLELELPVISQWNYPRLKIAPCRFAGSAYLDDLIIAGHNYRSYFGGLKNLLPGDSVSFTDTDGNVFAYTVADVEILGRDDLEKLESGGWPLTLFTCTVDTRARVVVRCEMETQDGTAGRAG